MNALAPPFSELIAAFARETGAAALVGDAGDLLTGLEQLAAELAVAGAEVHRANLKGLRLDAVVNNPAQYPSVARLHATFDDLLALTLPPEVAKWAAHLVRLPRIPFYEEARTYLLILAKSAPNPQLRALYRLIAIELVRIHLVVHVHMDTELRSSIPIEALSLLKIAAEEVDRSLGHIDPALDIREFHVLLASALCQLVRHARMLAEETMQLDREVREAQERRAQVDMHVAGMDSVDALLIRNALAGKAKVKIERLQDLHPMLLGKKKRNTIDQRLSRLMKRIEQDGLESIKRRGQNLLDIVTTSAVDEKPGRGSKKTKKKEPLR